MIWESSEHCLNVKDYYIHTLGSDDHDWALTHDAGLSKGKHCMPDLVGCNIACVDFMGAGDLDIQMLNLQLMVLGLVCTLIIQTSRYVKQKSDSHAQI